MLRMQRTSLHLVGNAAERFAFPSVRQYAFLPVFCLQPCVELLEMKTREFVGLLPLLSEETRLPKGRRRPSAALLIAARCCVG